MKLTFALIGNQNCGKTTLFNQLTGSNQHVGNFPGVTVDKKEGPIRKHPDATVVDLPGIYSLSPYTTEEVVTSDFLIRDKPDAIINILDATNIERNLYLTLQLMELRMPMVLAFNMMDEVRASGVSIDIPTLSERMGVPIVPISASKNEGVDELVSRAIEVAEKKIRPGTMDFCVGEVHRAIHSIAHIVEDHAQERDIPIRYAATKLVEGDPAMTRTLGISEREIDIIGHIVDDLEKNLHTDREAALADMRYDAIQRLTADTVKKPTAAQEESRSVRMDRILTHKVWAIPIFLGIMLLVFWLTFGVVGKVLSDLLSWGIGEITDLVDGLLTRAQVNLGLHSLVIDGVFAGVGSVLSFLPTIVVLFFFLSMLEDSGYMARVAFIMDKLLRKIGLSGRSFVPMLIGLGCSVPAIMATRTLSSERDRKMTMLLIPFMSCSAKLPIYAVFTAAFFPEYGALVMMALYVMGMVLAVVMGLLLKNSLFKGNPVPFVLELPAYRFPSFKSVMLHMWDKAKDFLQRAFTIIFYATIIIWVLQNFDIRGNMVIDSAESILAAIGAWIAPVFAPLGFGSWQCATALISGLTAKEAVVSTMAVLLGAQSPELLGPMLTEFFTPLKAFSFLTFTLLYTPCVAALAALRREMGKVSQVIMVTVGQIGIAWVAAFAVYQVGRLFVG